MGYVEEPDGTRVYDHGTRYKPLEMHERKYRKFPPGTIWFAGKPYGPLPVLPEEERAPVPWTRSDAEGASHHLGCACFMCRNVPRVRELKRQRHLHGVIRE